MNNVFINPNLFLLKKISFFILFSVEFVLYFNDFRNIKYDSEPDYISNGFVIHKYFKPIGNHHPGTISYYLVSLKLKISEFLDLGVDKTIYFIRILFY